MTEKELYAAYAEKTGVSVKDATTNVNALIDLMLGAAEKDGKCVFGKLGTFKVKQVAAKAGRHVPAEKSMHGKAYDIAAIPAHTKIGFALSKSGKQIGK